MTVSSFAEEFVRESALIEGQVIPENQIARSGHMRAYQSMTELADDTGPLLEQDIKNWQTIIGAEQHKWGDPRTLNTDDLGRYRDHNIYIGSGAFKPDKAIGAKFYEIPDKMKTLIELINRMPAVFRPDKMYDYVAWLHWKYERIHPFTDGNGRSGRLVALWMLRRANLPPILFENACKHQYYYPCFEQDSDIMMARYFQTHRATNWQQPVGAALQEWHQRSTPPTDPALSPPR